MYAVINARIAASFVSLAKARKRMVETNNAEKSLDARFQWQATFDNLKRLIAMRNSAEFYERLCNAFFIVAAKFQDGDEAIFRTAHDKMLAARNDYCEILGMGKYGLPK